MFSALATKLPSFARRVSSLSRSPSTRTNPCSKITKIGKPLLICGLKSENFSRCGAVRGWSKAPRRPMRLDRRSRKASDENLVDSVDSTTESSTKQLIIKDATLLPVSLEDLLQMCAESCFAGFEWNKKSPEAIAEYQKQQLGILYKESLATNPFWKESRFDQRWMGTTVNDEVYDFLLRNLDPHLYTIFALRAPSGAGKTGAIYQLSEHKFILYTECGRDRRDYIDYPYQGLNLKIDALETAAHGNNLDPVYLSKAIVQFCTVFWLSHAIALDVLSSKIEDLTPRDWLYWSTNGGGEVIASIQTLLNDYFAKTNILKPEVIQEQFLNRLFKKHGVWVVVDEAQLALTKAQGLVLSSRKEPSRSLLSALLLYSFNIETPRVVSGTGLSKVEEVLKTAVAKKSSVYYQSESILRFPLLSPTQVKMYLYEKLALTALEGSCNKAQLDHLQLVVEYICQHLQGRPRFLASFLEILADTNLQAALESDDTELPLTAPTDVDMAIEVLEKCAKIAYNKIRQSCYNLLKSAVDRQPPKSKQLLIRHLMEVGIASMLDDIVYNSKELEEDFGIGPEDLGVVTFKKSKEYQGINVVHYAVCEPKMLDILWEWIGTNSTDTYPLSELRTQLFLALTAVEKGEKGYCLERLAAHCLLNAKIPALLEKFEPEQPAGAEQKKTLPVLKPKWRIYGYAPHLRPLTEITEMLQSAKADIQAYLQSKDESLLAKLTSKLKMNKYLADVTWTQRNLSVCLEILSVENVDYVNEFLFMLLQPKDILIHPTDLCGPDLIGYIDNYVVAASFNLWKDPSLEKYHSNVETLLPWNWHKKNRSTDVKKLAMLVNSYSPLSAVGLNFSLPKTSAHREPYQIQHESGQNALVVDFSEDSPALVDYLGDEIITIYKAWRQEAIKLKDTRREQRKAAKKQQVAV